MSATDKIPGYRGYEPSYVSQFVTSKDIPSKKYEDQNEVPRDAMTGSQYLSNYANSHNVARNFPAEFAVEDSLPNQNFKNFKESRDDLLEKRRLHEYEQRPTYWSTTYQSTLNGWKEAAESKERLGDGLNVYVTQRNYKQIQQMNEGLVVQNPEGSVLPRREPKSSYQMCYGKAGEGPQGRYVPADGPAGFSRRATTRDLFLGTTKGSARIPNYAGHVPGSINNINIIRNNVAPETKDNLIANYRHDIPHYTGYKTQAVVNDRGPRNPASKVPLPSGLHAGLVLESMRFS